MKDALLVALPSCGQQADRRKSPEARFDSHLVNLAALPSCTAP